MESIKELVLRALEGEDVSVALFGSHASGRSGISSDVDIAVIPHGRLDGRKLALLRAELEESNIPYKVDVVDFSLVSPVFREFALQRARWWKK